MPRLISISLARIVDLQVTLEIADSNAINESTPKGSDEEYSNDEEPSDNEILNFSVDGPEPIRRIVIYLVRRFEEMFPKIQGKRRLNPREFDQALEQLRTMF